MARILLIWLGKLLLLITRIKGGGGSALPGLIVEVLDPGFIGRFLPQLKGGSLLVTGTNGKTTTTKIIRTILEEEGYSVVTNRAGSNMSRGIVSALIEHSTWRGKLKGDIGLFEVDEAFMPDVAAKLRPRAVVVLNLLRDQLDRYGELDRTAQLIGAGLEHTEQAVLNADDPLVVSLEEYAREAKVSFFGASPHIKRELPSDEQLHQQRGRRVGPGKNVETKLVGARQTDGGQVLKIDFKKSSLTTTLHLPGLYNAYNATAAAAASLSLGISQAAITKGLSAALPAFGRSETITLSGKTFQLLLVKNPAGFNQVIKTFLRGSTNPVLFAINDHFADGRDVSWLWDVDFEAMAASRGPISITGTRGYDLAVRLKYTNLASTVDLNMAQALAVFADQVSDHQTGYIVPTYTAMLELRKLLGKEAKVAKVWR